jgi:hypothetical protein
MADVAKIPGFVVLGYTKDTVNVSKVVGFVIIDTSAQAVPVATVKKRVSVRGRIYYTAS